MRLRNPLPIVTQAPAADALGGAQLVLQQLGIGGAHEGGGRPATGSAGDRGWFARGAGASVDRRSSGHYAAQLRQLVASLSSNRPRHSAAQAIVMSTVGARRSAALVAPAFAATCAAGGFQVLLVDANLADPGLHELFGVSGNVGLSDILLQEQSAGTATQPTSIPNLAMLPAGLTSSNYASLLSRQSVIQRLEPIAQSFDYMVIDGSKLPPTLLARVALDADQVIVTVRRHRSSMRDLKQHLDMLRGEGIANLSILIIE